MPDAKLVADLFAVRGEVRVAIADSRRLIADALAEVMKTQSGIDVIVTGGGDRSQLDALVADQPDVVLIGTGAHVDEAIRFGSLSRALLPALGLVFLADELEPELVDFVLADGLSGLVLTDASADDIVACVRQVVAGGTVLPKGWQQHARAAVQRSPVSALSERQVEVLQLLAEGLSYSEIASRLFISVNTVKFHIKTIFIALGVRNRTSAARLFDSSARG